MKRGKVGIGALWLGALVLALAGSRVVWAGGDGGGAPAHEHVFTGKFTAVDVAGASVTLENKNGETHTFTVTADTKVRVNDKAGTLADVHVGDYGGVKTGEDIKVAVMVGVHHGEPKGDK